jgi:hypothetical protein
MDLKIRSTSDQSINKLNVLIYGMPGAGKTRFLGSAAKRFKTIIASAESGLLSLKNMKDETGAPIACDYVQIDKFEDLENLTRFLMAGTHDYTCLGIDSGTEIQQVCMDYILRQEGREKPQLQDWGTLNNKMVRMVRYFRDMSKMNLIMTALAEEAKNEDTSTVFKPLFQGQIQRTIAGYFDIVAYSFVKTKDAGAETEESKHMILCRGKEKYVTKDRSGILPPYLPNDFTEMYKHIFEREEKK